uniref:Uncharacterized protein LOC105055692 n=1 Tax=Elaeis guineensis var. tenera TaxID=51953 RepID=A0A6I9S193_ELAGV|nr:uncharacterized protein LOC105055692 [Elaeis guineensis]
MHGFQGGGEERLVGRCREEKQVLQVWQIRTELGDGDDQIKVGKLLCYGPCERAAYRGEVQTGFTLSVDIAIADVTGKAELKRSSLFDKLLNSPGVAKGQCAYPCLI